MNNSKKVGSYVVLAIALLVVGGIFYKKDQKAEPNPEQQNETAGVPVDQGNLASNQTQAYVQPAATAFTAPQAEISIISPKIASSGETKIESGDLEVTWKSKNVSKVTVSVIGMDGTVLVSGSPVDASKGEYTLEIPKAAKGSTAKYKIAITDSASLIVVNSNPFTISSK